MIIYRVDKNGNGPYYDRGTFKDTTKHTAEYGRPNIYDDAKAIQQDKRKQLLAKELLFGGTKKQLINWFQEFKDELIEARFSVKAFNLEPKDYIKGDFQTVFINSAVPVGQYSIEEFFK